MNPPCKGCPFRRDVEPYLRRERGIALALGTRQRDNKFYCHETINYGARSKVKRMANAEICRGFAILRAQESGNRFVKDHELVYRSIGEMIAAYLEHGV